MVRARPPRRTGNTAPNTKKSLNFLILVHP
jgi:hypothetical protein